jgi:antitoxin (DNA-binding transcriptional repressor) of toxin-antitoxin stability system
MVKVAVAIAKTRRAEPVERAIDGEVVVIARAGKPVVTFLPATDNDADIVHKRNSAESRDSIRRLREYARQHPVPDLSYDVIKSWIEEGRP